MCFKTTFLSGWSSFSYYLREENYHILLQITLQWTEPLGLGAVYYGYFSAKMSRLTKYLTQKKMKLTCLMCRDTWLNNNYCSFYLPCTETWKLKLKKIAALIHPCRMTSYYILQNSLSSLISLRESFQLLHLFISIIVLWHPWSCVQYYILSWSVEGVYPISVL